MQKRRNAGDAEIRRHLVGKLFHDHRRSVDTLILGEFGTPTARADIAVVNGSLHCYEIKSATDSLSRLSNQVPGYSKVFDKVTVVAHLKHLPAIKRKVPDCWGIIAFDPSRKRVFQNLRKAVRNTELDGSSLARMLWKDEARALLLAENIFAGDDRAPIIELWDRIASELPPRRISTAVRNAIKQRSGSGFRPPLSRCDGSYPI